MNIVLPTVNFTNKNMETEELYYSSGLNFGNCLFHYSAKTLFFKHNNDRLVNEINSDTLFMRAEANLINNGFIPYAKELLNNVLKDAKKIFCISIGHQKQVGENVKYDECIIRLMKMISSRSINILTRGSETTKILHEMGVENVVSVGCPSMMINNDKQLGEKIVKKVKKNNFNKIAFGIHDIKTEYSKHMINLCKKYNGVIVLQDDINILKLSRDHKSCREIRDIYIQHYSDVFSCLEEFECFIINNTVFFNIIPEWLEYLSTFDLYIGLKIHGSIAGLMSGIPSICVIHDSRISELVDSCVIPYINAIDFINCTDINQIIKYHTSRLNVFDDNRKSMAKIYVRELIKNNISPSTHLIKLSENDPND